MRYSFWNGSAERREKVSNPDTGLSALITELSRTVSTAIPKLDDSSFLKSVLDIGTTQPSTGSSLTGSSEGLKNLAVGTDTKVTSIQFGKPSSDVTTSSSSGSSLQNLLSSSVSGGVSSLLGGGLGSLAGLGGLITSITSLFGGSSSTPQPLQLFSLPDSIESNVVTGSSANGGTLPSVGQASSKSIIYTAPPASPSSSSGTTLRATSPVAYSSAAATKNLGQMSASAPLDSSVIAAAVKSALLSSNTLGDVIAEI